MCWCPPVLMNRSATLPSKRSSRGGRPWSATHQGCGRPPATMPACGWCRRRTLRPSPRLWKRSWPSGDRYSDLAAADAVLAARRHSPELYRSRIAAQLLPSDGYRREGERMNSHALSGSRSSKEGNAGTPGPAGTHRSSRQRRDIQGLRALAVVAVIVNHLFERPAGGFVGVDVFFVISGFLISGLLVREVAASGRIDFVAFYVRRARRILPMALLVVVVTVAATYLLYNSARGAAVRTDGVFAALFAANWHFAAVGTDYWQTDGVVSPLQHYWSLAVEEQFYLFWPWLIIAAAFIGMRTGRRSPTSVTAGLMALVAAASFGYALWQVAAAPTWAYFSTFTRTWELAAGALAALALPLFGRLDTRLRSAMAVMGLVDDPGQPVRCPSGQRDSSSRGCPSRARGRPGDCRWNRTHHTKHAAPDQPGIPIPRPDILLAVPLALSRHHSAARFLPRFRDGLRARRAVCDHCPFSPFLPPRGGSHPAFRPVGPGGGPAGGPAAHVRLGASPLEASCPCRPRRVHGRAGRCPAPEPCRSRG